MEDLLVKKDVLMSLATTERVKRFKKSKNREMGLKFR